MTYNLTEFKEWLVKNRSILKCQVGFVTLDLTTFVDEEVTEFAQLLDRDWLFAQLTKYFSTKNIISSDSNIRIFIQSSVQEVNQIVALFIRDQEWKTQRVEIDQLKTQKEELDTNLATHDFTLANLRQELEACEYLIEKSKDELLESQKEKIELMKFVEKEIKILIWILQLAKETTDQNSEFWKESEEERKNILTKLKKEKELEISTLKQDWESTKDTYLPYYEEISTSLTYFINFYYTNQTLANQLKAKETELIKLRDTTSQSTASLRKEIENLKGKLQTQSINKDSKITQLEGQITQLKQQLKNQTDLESQLTALALSSGLLSQQCENLAGKLTVSEQESQCKTLELTIKDNLLKDKDNSLSQQEQQLRDYQTLLRKSEEQLSKCQRIINDKSEVLTKLEEAKNELTELLDQSGEKITQLEDSLLTSQTKISELESKIEELEAKGDNSEQLTRSRKELVALKSQLQSEINDLKTQLQQAKLR